MYTGAHWRLHAARSSEHRRLVSPHSITLREQASSAERDTRAGSPTAVAVLERARRDHQFARETTLRRWQRDIFDQRRVEKTERAEREAAAAMTRADRVIERTARARGFVAAAAPPPPVRVQHVHSRSERPGDEVFLDGSVSLLASTARVEFSAKLRTAVVAKASALLTSISPRRCIRRSSCRYGRRGPKWTTARGRVS